MIAKARRPVAFWLEQIIAMAETLAEHISGMDADMFVADQKTIDATSWCISCIGESCGKILEIEPEFERRYGTFDLAAAYAARNRYVHGYFDLDVAQIWDTASIAVPRIKEMAQAIRDGRV